ncbi:MAG: histidine--tRNA ligase [Bacteroidales bacterium]|nr:histidine--tRNA ligase [Bacteroidales bacterium]
MAQKPSIPKGTRDFLPDVTVRRNYIFDTVREVFRRYGFQPIETPSMENLSTLMGKYGEEGDKLLFRILNSGDFLSSVQQDGQELHSEKIVGKICEKGLRYDLTVPFARFVTMYRDQIAFPFKRYQIQPVWRADRPQKGRYREFYQCDVDIIGSDSLLNEAELVRIVNDVFTNLKINVILKINNRKILAGIAEYIGKSDALVDITVAIDKLDKIGIDAVNAELASKGLEPESINKLQPILFMKGDVREKISQLKPLLNNEIGQKGIAELETLFDYIENMELNIDTELDLTLARGLNYYTGAIFEVKAKDFPMGSISGGGRYDNLTGIFGFPNVSGVGISFGADRIYDVLEGLNLFPETMSESTKVIFLNFGKNEEKYCLKYLDQVRKHGINAEIYPDAAKIQKQMKYADQRNIPIVVIAGEQEVSENKFTVKWMKEGRQESVNAEEINAKLLMWNAELLK